jgi:elongation factor P
MKIAVNDIRKGNILEYQNNIWLVLNTEHVKPGKGPAYVQVKMKSVLNDTNNNVRFNSNDTVMRVSLNDIKAIFLYETNNLYYFMNNNDYSEIVIDGSSISDDVKAFLSPEIQVTLVEYDGKIIECQLPDTMVMEVITCDATIKNQTAASSYKPATLINNVTIMVPPFINQGDYIVIKTATMEYVERAK